MGRQLQGLATHAPGKLTEHQPDGLQRLADSLAELGDARPPGRALWPLSR